MQQPATWDVLQSWKFSSYPSHNKPSSASNFQKVTNSREKHIGVDIIDYIVNTEQRSLFASRHTISEQ